MERRKYPACLIFVNQSTNMTEDYKMQCNNHVINFIVGKAYFGGSYGVCVEGGRWPCSPKPPSWWMIEERKCTSWPKWPKPSVCHIPIPCGTLLWHAPMAHCDTLLCYACHGTGTSTATCPFCHRRAPPSATQLFLWNVQRRSRREKTQSLLNVSNAIVSRCLDWPQSILTTNANIKLV